MLEILPTVFLSTLSSVTCLSKDTFGGAGGGGGGGGGGDDGEGETAL